MVGGVQGPTTNLEKINIFPTSPPPLVPPVTQDIFRMNWKKKPEQELIPLSGWSKNSHGEGCPALSSHFLCPAGHNPV